MKQIKKIALNKKVVSILGGNDMNHVRGGTYCPNDAIPAPKTSSPLTPAPAPTMYC